MVSPPASLAAREQLVASLQGFFPAEDDVATDEAGQIVASAAAEADAAVARAEASKRQLPEAWLALAIVAGAVLLFLVAYWRRGSDEAYA